MHPYPDDVTGTDDLTLLRSARAGDRLAFGVLYLRHHAAAWRIACVASRFSPDAELAVIDGFTRVFSALPAESDEFENGGVTFRPYLLACVRQSALDRARDSGRADAGPGARGTRRQPSTGPRQASPLPASLAGLTLQREVQLSGLEHHVARGGLAALPERARLALWLSDVEAMTPGEVAGILGGQPEEISALAAAARTEIHTVQQTALDRQEVRADCRFTVEHLGAYQVGALDPAEGLLVRSHLSGCLTCRMRNGELGNAPGALAAAVPAAPLLGGEAQHHWLASLAHIQPAERLLPPVLAAGGVIPRESLARRTATHLGAVAEAAAAPARVLPDALRRAGRAAAGAWHGDSIDLTTRSPRSTSSGWTGSPGASGSPVPSLPPTWTIPPRRAIGPRPDRRAGRRPGLIAVSAPLLALTGRATAYGSGLAPLARRATRAVRPSLPGMALAVAWVLVMMTLPRLMGPSTAPGPDDLALPAVQAYVPGFFSPGDGSASGGAVSRGRNSVRAGGSSAKASDRSRGSVGSADPAAAPGPQPPIGAVAAASGPPGGNRSGAAAAPADRRDVAVPAAPEVAGVAAAVTPAADLTVTASDVTALSGSSLGTPVTAQFVDNDAAAVSPNPNRPKAADKPAADKPAADKATADKATARRPTADKPAADRPDRPKADGRKIGSDEPKVEKADRARRNEIPRRRSVPRPRFVTA